MSKIDNFNKMHQDALNSILGHLNSPNNEMKAIATFLYETDANPYNFLSDSWAGHMSTSTGFDSLLHSIWHALIDDGDMCFPCVDGHPRIRFFHKSEIQEKDILCEIELQFPRDRNITFLKDSFEFIEKYKEYQIRDLKRCFISDYVMQRTTNYALEHYPSNPLFNTEWINEAEEKRKRRNSQNT